MLYDYIALAVFTVLAFLVPLIFIVGSKLIARRSPGNHVKNAPWESGELSVGRARDIDNEYLPFFSLFLPFEVIVGILVVWSAVAYGLSYSVDLGMIILALAAGVAAGFGFKTIVG
jgi:NADH:ubiquinone oxidoreductase subunit 3 (subunit A)